MAFELVVLVAQAVSVFFLAAWLTTGVWENIVYPDLNRTFTSEVLDMTRMREAYPDAYERVAHRRVTSPKLQNLMFRFIVLCEAVATLVLWIGAVSLALSVFGLADLDFARSVALGGVLLFTCVWAGFLVAGNWFCYWFCHEAAQNTHYQMTLWGMATLILIVSA